MIVTSEKKRHEILGGRIRALYGHSTEGKILKEPATPPERLFHGTPHRFVENILSEGLLAQKRQYVHLSADIETAFIVGKRRDDSPIIFEINAKNANANGVVFYKGNENIWLSNHVPIQFLKKLK